MQSVATATKATDVDVMDVADILVADSAIDIPIFRSIPVFMVFTGPIVPREAHATYTRTRENGQIMGRE